MDKLTPPLPEKAGIYTTAFLIGYRFYLDTYTCLPTSSPPSKFYTAFVSNSPLTLLDDTRYLQFVYKHVVKSSHFSLMYVVGLE
jgi:hypothetical protein